jgi:ABC-type uncharacterized transport system substrate-binding protein
MGAQIGGEMNNRRKLLVALGAGALVAPLGGFAQQPARIHRIGFLGSASAANYADRLDTMRAALRDLGYVDSRNVAYEYRWTEGRNERLPELATELVRSKCDVIVTGGTGAILALKGATATIPIVMSESGDAVATGLVESLARPGGNVTGMTFFSPELTAKRLELLKELLPRLAQVGYLANPDNRATSRQIAMMDKTAALLKVRVQLFGARSRDEFDAAFAAIAKARIQAILVAEDVVFSNNYGMVAELTARHRLPSIGGKLFGDGGGVIGYGVNYLDLYRRTAYFVDRILKGTKPADLPVEQPTKFELVINMKTAKALGITIPQSILVRADRVIE